MTTYMRRAGDRSRSDVLGTIVAATRRVLETRRGRRPERALERAAAERRPCGVAAFESALTAVGRPNVIAECKRRSPSRGVLRGEYDAVSLARAYERAGAAAVSVLTEPMFFDGALEHLEQARAAISLPLLRKDFVIDRYQLLEARAAGADAVLLIVAALEAGRLRVLSEEARALDLAALIEVHDERELETALDSAGGGTPIIGVNHRNLRTLDVDVASSEALAARIPPDAIAVAESGLASAEDLRRLGALGFDAFLVGEHLVTSPDPEAALRDLCDVRPSVPRPPSGGPSAG